MVETATALVKYGKLKLRVVGPNQQNLDELRKKWLEWLAKAEKNMDSPTTLANADQSVPDLSSIVLLAEYGKKTILLTGDARSDYLLKGLEQAGQLTGGKLHVDVLKVAHHGSNRNHTATFFKKVTADTYVISANGKDDNPDYETLKWIVEAAKAAGRKIKRRGLLDGLQRHTPLALGHQPQAWHGHAPEVRVQVRHCEHGDGRGERVNKQRAERTHRGSGTLLSCPACR